MKNNHCRLSRYMLILLMLTISCGSRQMTGQAEEKPAEKTSVSNQTFSTTPEGMSEMFKGTVMEVIDAGRHIYVHIDNGFQKVWVAVPAFDGKIGDKVLVPPAVPVANFKSRNLNRTFKVMYFVGGLRKLDKGKSE
jgi:hypothetical protein